MLTIVMVFALLDRKLREYGQLMHARNEESMERVLVDAIVGTGVLADKYPEDFDLFCLGDFDTETGVIDGETPRLVDNLASIFMDSKDRKELFRGAEDRETAER